MSHSTDGVWRCMLWRVHLYPTQRSIADQCPPHSSIWKRWSDLVKAHSTLKTFRYFNLCLRKFSQLFRPPRNFINIYLWISCALTILTKNFSHSDLLNDTGGSLCAQWFPQCIHHKLYLGFFIVTLYIDEFISYFVQSFPRTPFS